MEFSPTCAAPDEVEIEVTEMETVDQVINFIKETFGLDNFLKIALTTEP